MASTSGRDFIVGWVAPIGVELDADGNENTPIKVVQRYFAAYPHEIVKVIDFIKKLEQSNPDPSPNFDSDNYHLKTRARQEAGNNIRISTNNNSVLALHCVFEISEFRIEHPETLRVIQIRSLKHPDEAMLLREIYGDSFFLIGVHGSYSDRKELLRSKCDSEDNATDLIKHDAFESDTSGQNTRDLFELCDGFVSLSTDWEPDLKRLLDLCTSHYNEVPRLEEFGMQIAYNSSFRSGDLARQVGASLFDSNGSMLSVGRNDAPMPKGGLYQVGQNNEVSDYRLGFDSGERYRQELLSEITNSVKKKLPSINAIADLDEGIRTSIVDGISDLVESVLKSSRIKDIIEFGRSVHAEMDAIVSAAFKGVPVAGSTLFVTTFPCHTCARHIIAAGISKIVYVQPYPKSQALKLHADALESEYLEINNHKDIHGQPVPGPSEKILVEPLIGVAPRRYHSLFAMWTPTGERTERKFAGKAIKKPNEDEMTFRFPFDEKAVLQLEAPMLEKYHGMFQEQTEEQK